MSREVLQRLHVHRKVNFSIQQELPKRLVVRKTKFNILWICFLIVVIAVFYYKILHSDDSVSLFVYILCAIIALLGSVLKVIFSYLFPEIIIDENGILFRNRQKISWNKIKFISINSQKINTEIIIVFKNGKKLIEYFDNLNYDDFSLKKLLRSYSRKYKAFSLD